MLVDFLIGLIVGAVQLFPTLPANLIPDFSAAFNMFGAINYYVPIDTILKLSAVYVVFFKFKFVFKLIKWILSRIVI